MFIQFFFSIWTKIPSSTLPHFKFLFWMKLTGTIRLESKVKRQQEAILDLILILS